jgi:hypothetical protein
MEEQEPHRPTRLLTIARETGLREPDVPEEVLARQLLSHATEADRDELAVRYLSSQIWTARRNRQLEIERAAARERAVADRAREQAERVEVKRRREEEDRQYWARLEVTAELLGSEFALGDGPHHCHGRQRRVLPRSVRFDVPCPSPLPGGGRQRLRGRAVSPRLRGSSDVAALTGHQRCGMLCRVHGGHPPSASDYARTGIGSSV